MKALESFHPAVREWFLKHFPAPTEPQALAWPAIKGGQHTLIAAPTGSGKKPWQHFSPRSMIWFEATAGEARRRNARCLRFTAEGPQQ
jgi:hypothetical protein